MKISEKTLIDRLQQQFLNKLPKNITGIGDDCAAIPQDKNHSLLITTDLLIEGTHFLREKIAAVDLGYKTIAVNLSDIAAMGGTPKYAFLSAALPVDINPDWLENFIVGMNEILTEHKVLLLGGDTAKSTQNIFINVMLVGEAENNKIKYRVGAKTNDIVCVTGNLGDSKAGLEYVLKNHANDKLAKELLLQHYRPRPQIAEGLFLANLPAVHAMLDVSDGINLDLQRLRQASNCGINIDLNKLPLSKNLLLFAEKFKLSAIEIAAIGGEDYCLLATVDKNYFNEIALNFKKKFKRELTAIGKITATKKIEYFLNNKPHKLSMQSFSHF